MQKKQSQSIIYFFIFLPLSYVTHQYRGWIVQNFVDKFPKHGPLQIFVTLFFLGEFNYLHTVSVSGLGPSVQLTVFLSMERKKKIKRKIASFSYVVRFCCSHEHHFLRR
jgi:hypothetical protein